MVARFFRNNDPLGFILLPVAAIAALLFTSSFPGLAVRPYTHSFLFSLMGTGVPSWLLTLLNLAGLVFGAYLITFLCIKQEISDKQNLIPGFFFIVFSSVVSSSSNLHPVIIANLFLIGAFHRIF